MKFCLLRTALLAIIGFMPTPGKGTIGSLDYTPQERKILAQRLVVEAQYTYHGGRRDKYGITPT